MTKDIFEELKIKLPNLKSGVLLKDHTTFNIGGPAKYFLEVSKRDYLIEGLKLAKKFKIPFFILGGGSNVLVSDKGFDGLVLSVKNYGQPLKIKDNIIEALAGIEVGELVKFSVDNSLQGLEWAGGLPGTFGGAIRGNAGAFGGEIKDSILEVECLDKNLKIRKLTNFQCQFSYRSSIFKEKNWIIISAKLKFNQGQKEELQKIAKSNMDYRKDRHPLELPNAGSIFKNCEYEKLSKKIQKEFSGLVKNDPFPIVPVVHFIIRDGLKGLKIGGAQISEKHPNFIVNTGNAKAQDVLKLISTVKSKIKKKYGVNLEQEVQYLE